VLCDWEQPNELRENSRPRKRRKWGWTQHWKKTIIATRPWGKQSWIRASQQNHPGNSASRALAHHRNRFSRSPRAPRARMPPISPPPNEKPAETTTKLTRRNRAPDARSQRTGWRTGGGRRSYGRDSSPSRLLCRPWGWGLSEDSRIFVGSSEGQGRDRSERASGRNNTKRGGGDRESAKRSNFLQRTLDGKHCVLPLFR